MGYRRMNKDLEMPDRHYLSAAIGWLGLGNCDEAYDELVKISSAQQTHPAVLAVSYEIHARVKNWELAAKTARTMTDLRPDEPQSWISLAYATRRQPEGGIAAAREILVKAHQAFPQEAIIVYNLACYESQLGQLPQAREWLGQAFALGGKKQIKQMALSDHDLEPLWAEIEKA